MSFAQSCRSDIRAADVFSSSFIPGSLSVVHLYPHTSTNPYHTIIVILTRAYMRTSSLIILHSAIGLPHSRLVHPWHRQTESLA